MARQSETTTRLVILGQLALRDWSSYELARSMRRTLHWFWPRAESVIYAEAKRLEADGLAESRVEPAADGSRRTRSIYSITPAGRSQLTGWLSQPPVTFTMHLEPLVRIHLARFGTRDDLLAAIDSTNRAAASLLDDAEAVAAEFVSGNHLFQDEAHTRGLLFDALVGQANSLQDWAAGARKEVETWPNLEGDETVRRRAVTRMQRFLETRAAPSPVGGHSRSP